MLESLAAIGTLIFLEGILSIDNAIAMALQVKGLEPSLQRRALLYGLGGAYLLRAIALLGAKWLMNVWWLQEAGALYLLYLAIGHFTFRRVAHQADGDARASGWGFWGTIAMVELTDAAFALDSTLVAVGMSNQAWVVFTGVGLGILAVRYAAVLFVKLIERCPEIEDLGFLVVGWVGIRLFSEGWEKMSTVVLLKPYDHLLPDWVFWSGIAIMVAIGGGLVLRERWFKGKSVAKLPPPKSLEKLLHRLPISSSVRRVVVLIVGSLVLLAGIAMIFLPGPAIVVIPAGLAILATEFQWARNLLDKGKMSMKKVLGRQ